MQSSDKFDPPEVILTGFYQDVVTTFTGYCTQVIYEFGQTPRLKLEAKIIDGQILEAWFPLHRLIKLNQR